MEKSRRAVVVVAKEEASGNVDQRLAGTRQDEPPPSHCDAHDGVGGELRPRVATSSAAS